MQTQQMMDWVVERDQVSISSTILGRGAFGEVRVAQWRCIDVACKVLYCQDSCIAGGDLCREIEMLATLRHPNLVLFLGILLDERKQPQAILTELLRHSLYDLLEIKNTKLTLMEILDLGLDIAYGIDYLHSHEPPIVHRDISSKNILISGNRAKIADMGQAKIFGQGTTSQNTGMPGAMAYAAPDVLAGKYTEKIDIFSFGVLLVQMCTNEYPRIEKRDDQKCQAMLKQPTLSTAIEISMNYHPLDRSSAQQMCQVLQSIKANDRYYPIDRLETAPFEIGVMARRWMTEEVERRCRECVAESQQKSELLAVQAERWQAEAHKVDSIVLEQVEQRQEISLLKGLLEAEMLKVEDYRLAGLRQSDTIQSSEQAIRDLQADKSRLVDYVKDLENKLHQKTFEFESQVTAVESLKQQLDAQKRSAAQARLTANQSGDKEKDARQQVQCMQDDISELETRLEQALTRWKGERDALSQEKHTASKLRTANAAFAARESKLKEELLMLRNQLDEYKDLPLADEIRIRFRNLDKEVVSNKVLIADISQQRDDAKKKATEFQSQSKESQQRGDMLYAELSEKNIMLQRHNAVLDDWSQKCDYTASALATAVRLCEDLKHRTLNQETDVVTLQQQNAELTSELERERAIVHSMMLKQHVLLSKPGTAHGQPHQQHHQPSQQQEILDISTDITAIGQVGTGEGHMTLTNYFDQTIVIEQDEEAIKDDQAKAQVKLELESRGLLGLIELICQHMKDESIVWRSARAIRELVIGNQTNAAKNECLTQKLDEVLLINLKIFPHSAPVQGQCMRLLGALAFGSDVVRRRVGEKQGMEHVVVALEEHAEDDTVVLHACTAITNLTHNSADNRKRFVDGSGLEVLVSVMDRHRSSVKIQRQACWAMLSLSASDDISRLIAQAGGISAVTSAMTAHREDSSVQQFGCWTLNNLALAGDDIKRKLKKMGVVELCRIALETHSGDVEVVRQARSTLGVVGPAAVVSDPATAPSVTGNSPSRRKITA